MLADRIHQETCEWRRAIKLLRALKERIEQRRQRHAVEFYGHIADLITNERVLSLDQYVQHYGYTRLTHSLDVAFYSFTVAKAFGWDARSAARGGLLHDLFFYDCCHTEQCMVREHLTSHPKVALENAREITTLNNIEEDIILRHMWLITLYPPRYKEGFIVTFVDKYCALKEFVFGALLKRQPRTFFAKRVPTL